MSCFHLTSLVPLKLLGLLFDIFQYMAMFHYGINGKGKNENKKISWSACWEYVIRLELKYLSTSK